MTNKPNKTISEKWTEVTTILLILLANWSGNKRRGDISIEQLVEEIGVPMKDYFKRVIKDTQREVEERMVEELNKAKGATCFDCRKTFCETCIKGLVGNIKKSNKPKER